MTKDEQITRFVSVLMNGNKLKAKTIKSLTGISSRVLRYRRVDIEEMFIDEVTDTLIEADNDGYFIVDINNDEQVDNFIRRRKSMIFTALKLLYRLEKAINKRRLNHNQLSFSDMIDDFKISFEREAQNEIHNSDKSEKSD